MAPGSVPSIGDGSAKDRSPGERLATSAVATPGAKAEKRIASSSGARPKSGSRIPTIRSQYGSASSPAGREAKRHGAFPSARLAITPMPRAAAAGTAFSSARWSNRFTEAWRLPNGPSEAAHLRGALSPE